MANFTTKKDVLIPWGQGILKYPKINKCANFLSRSSHPIL